MHNEPWYEDEPEPALPNPVWERLAGPITSTLVHVVILLILALTVSIAVKQNEEEQAPESFSMIQSKAYQADTLSDVADELSPVSELPVFDTSFKMTVPSLNTPTVLEPTVSVDVDVSSLSMVDSVPSVHVLQNLFANRSAVGRNAALRRFCGPGGPQGPVEASVKRALNWLHENQIKEGPNSGTWPTENRAEAAMAGLGLLTFLAHNELPGSKPYGETVSCTIDYLLRTQRDDGSWPAAGPHEYGHAIATYAVAEAHSITRHPSLGDAMERAVTRILDGTILERFGHRESMRRVSGLDQSTGPVTGAFWNYGYADGAWSGEAENPQVRRGVRKDHSYMGFQVQALKAAQVARAEDRRLGMVLEATRNGIKFMHSPANGAFQYSSTGTEPATRPGSVNQLGVGAYCLQLLEGRGGAEVERSVAALQEAGFDPSRTRAFYRIYYRANAHYIANARSAPDAFRAYYLPMGKWLVDHQAADGSWSETATGGTDTYERVYPTCLGALSLMVIYRYLPGAGAPTPPTMDSGRPDLEVRLIGGDFNR